MKTINWTEPMLKRFKQMHKEAVEKHIDGFKFDGNEFNTSYAGYLIEYLEEQFK